MNTQRQKVAHCEGCIWTTMPTQTRFLLTSETINGCRQFGTHSFAYKNPVCRTETDATMWASTKKCCFFFFFWYEGRKKQPTSKLQTNGGEDEWTNKAKRALHINQRRPEVKGNVQIVFKPGTKEEGEAAPHLALCVWSDRLSRGRVNGSDVWCFIRQVEPKPIITSVRKSHSFSKWTFSFCM